MAILNLLLMTLVACCQSDELLQSLRDHEDEAAYRTGTRVRSLLRDVGGGAAGDAPAAAVLTAAAAAGDGEELDATDGEFAAAAVPGEFVGGAAASGDGDYEFSESQLQGEGEDDEDVLFIHVQERGDDASGRTCTAQFPADADPTIKDVLAHCRIDDPHRIDQIVSMARGGRRNYVTLDMTLSAAGATSGSILYVILVAPRNLLLRALERTQYFRDNRHDMASLSCCEWARGPEHKRSHSQSAVECTDDGTPTTLHILGNKMLAKGDTVDITILPHSIDFVSIGRRSGGLFSARNGVLIAELNPRTLPRDLQILSLKTVNIQRVAPFRSNDWPRGLTVLRLEDVEFDDEISRFLSLLPESLREFRMTACRQWGRSLRTAIATMPPSIERVYLSGNDLHRLDLQGIRRLPNLKTIEVVDEPKLFGSNVQLGAFPQSFEQLKFQKVGKAFRRDIEHQLAQLAANDRPKIVFK